MVLGTSECTYYRPRRLHTCESGASAQQLSVRFVVIRVLADADIDDGHKWCQISAFRDSQFQIYRTLPGVSSTSRGRPHVGQVSFTLVIRLARAFSTLRAVSRTCTSSECR